MVTLDDHVDEVLALAKRIEKEARVSTDVALQTAITLSSGFQTNQEKILSALSAELGATAAKEVWARLN